MNLDNEVPNVKFNTDTETETTGWKAIKYYKETVTPKIIQWVTKYSGGTIKSERQAEYVLLGLVIVMFALSFYFFFGGNNTSQKLSAAQLGQMKNVGPINK